MIYNAKVVIPVLLVFVALLTYPLWQGGGEHPPVLEKPQSTVENPERGEQCVESAAWMRANHMQLLDGWRHEVVRKQQRSYTSTNGKVFDKSLVNTCLNCHKKSQFCDKCHAYTSVKLVCFHCHINPELVEP